MKINRNLLAMLHSDLKEFLTTKDDLIFNERDLQVRIAMWLKGKREHYDSVAVEYAVPKEELTARGLNMESGSTDFPWDNDLYTDIVVEKGCKFAALELKFATRPVINQPPRFGESIKGASQIIKEQSAVDLVMYNYWKDVRRIEALSQCYPNMIGGISLLVTNNRIYWKGPTKNGVSYSAFSTHEGKQVGAGLLKWGTISKKIIKSHPDFEIKGNYSCHWNDTAITTSTKNGDKFRYCIIDIH